MNSQYPQQQYPQQPGQQPYPQQPVPFNHALVTSAFELPGVTIVRNYGIVRGIIVRSRSVVGNIGASFQTLFGGNISIYTELCEQARREAYELMIQHAAELGANAIIGVRYDATEITQGVSEVLCYGTAVTVAQKAQ
ncbi:MAG TPA: YbjQ family protein [Ktedonobacterales bacterium]